MPACEDLVANLAYSQGHLMPSGFRGDAKGLDRAAVVQKGFEPQFRGAADCGGNRKDMPRSRDDPHQVFTNPHQERPEARYGLDQVFFKMRDERRVLTKVPIDIPARIGRS